VAENRSVKEVMNSEQLRLIAHELAEWLNDAQACLDAAGERTGGLAARGAWPSGRSLCLVICPIPVLRVEFSICPMSYTPPSIAGGDRDGVTQSHTLRLPRRQLRER
jgi:hypothetical protein